MSEIAPEDANTFGNLAKALANNEKKIRDRAMQSVSSWLLRSKQISSLDMAKLCRGLFFSMWWSDKPAVQMDVAERIAKLVGTYQKENLPIEEATEKTLLFIRTMMSEIEYEWIRIDRFRLDKFYSLIRKIVYQSLMLVVRWEMSSVFCTPFFDYFTNEVIFPNPNKLAGIRYHIVDLYIDGIRFCLEHIYPQLTEIDESTEQALDIEIPNAAIDLFLSPIFSLIPKVHDKIYAKHIAEMIFDKLLEEPFVPYLNLNHVASAIFSVASQPKTPGHFRKLLYALYQKYQKKSRELHPDRPWKLATQTDEDKKQGGKRKRASKKSDKDESLTHASDKVEVITGTASETGDLTGETHESIESQSEVKIEKKKRKKATPTKQDAKCADKQKTGTEVSEPICLRDETTPESMTAGAPAPSSTTTSGLPPKATKRNKKKNQSDAPIAENGGLSIAEAAQETEVDISEVGKKKKKSKQEAENSQVEVGSAKKKGVIFGLEHNTVKEYVKNEMMDGPITPVKLSRPRFGVLKSPSPTITRRQLQPSDE